jgi:chemotaxis protein methyltransferase CheR
MIGDTGLVSLAAPAMTPREFDQIRRLAHDQFGIELRPGKEQLVSARLSKIIRTMNLKSFQQYCDFLLADKSGEALTAMIDALTTNHTSFFREQAHFDFLKSAILPALKLRPRISIWSVACSTGEEPYSIVFCLMQNLSQQELRRTHILATDISTKALRIAKAGEYAGERFPGSLLQQVRPYLTKSTQKSAASFQVKKEVRDLVEFRRQNLMQDFSNLGPFPLIFCRNVMIYFDSSTQQELVRRLTDALEPDGYLFVGHAESLNRIQHSLEYIQPAIYRKQERNRSLKNRARVGL